jgi:hypothetical protein
MLSENAVATNKNPAYFHITVKSKGNVIPDLSIGLCIPLRVYQSIYIETSVRNKCRCLHVV